MPRNLDLKRNPSLYRNGGKGRCDEEGGRVNMRCREHVRAKG
jgi:hypothetical protein